MTAPEPPEVAHIPDAGTVYQRLDGLWWPLQPGGVPLHEADIDALQPLTPDPTRQEN